MMSWTLPILCATAGFLGCLSLGAPQEEVVARLRSSSMDPTEEEAAAAKVGVDLFNCQASAERHRTYPCTPDTEELQERPAGWLRLRSETPVHHSVRQPTLHETLVAGGHHRVAKLLEDITLQMGNMSGRRAASLREGHQSDLYHTQETVQDVCSQLESNLALVLAQQRWMEEVMEKLQQVNQSLGLMLVTVEGAQSQLENHLQHLHTVVDPAGWSPSAISTYVLHGSLLVLLVALLVPTPPCAAILFLLFLISSAFSIPALSALLALAVAGQWLVTSARRSAGGAWPVLPQEELRHPLTSTPDREHEIELLQEELDRMEMSCLQELSCLEEPPAVAGDLPGLAGPLSPVPGGWRTKLSSCGVTLEPSRAAGKRQDPKPCSPSHPPASDASLLSPRSPCQGLTRAGQRCRKRALPGQHFCHIHATGRASCSSLAMDLSPHV